MHCKIWFEHRILLKLFLAGFKRTVLQYRMWHEAHSVGLKTQCLCFFVEEDSIQMIRKMFTKDRTYMQITKCDLIYQV